jgi:hypothetical protein
MVSILNGALRGLDASSRLAPPPPLPSLQL